MVFNGILKLMPSRVGSFEFIVRRKKTTHYPLPTTHYKVKNAFTLIELIVVITLFGIVSTLVTASYITFERNQRIRNATQTLKNDLRLVQNKALAGDKGANSECPITSTLVGWYVTFDTTQTLTYSYAGVCNTSVLPFSSKTVTFPSGVALNNAVPPNTGIKIGGSPQGGIVTILFKPLATDVGLYSDSAPPFTHPITFSGDLVIELKGSQTSTVSTVTVRPTGEISGGQ